MGTLVDLDGVSVYRADPPVLPKASLIVIHEIWGLVDHIKRVADRFAAEGYLVLAPDLLGMIGIDPVLGTELHALMNGSEQDRLAAQPRMRDAMAPMHSPEYAGNTVAALKAVVDYLEAELGSGAHIAVTGFCFGGTYSFALAAADQRVKAAVPFYGTAPGPEEMGTIACPVLALYGSLDERLMNALPTVTTEMADAGVDFTPKVYEGAKHAFFNDTGANYDADAAADAWTRALAFLDANLCL